MSRLPNGNNGHLNGDYHSNTANPYDQSYRNHAPAPNNQDRRPGGYGGFSSSGNTYPSDPGSTQRFLGSSDDHHASSNDGSRYAGSRVGDRSQGERYLGTRAVGQEAVQNASSLTGSGPGGRQIEDVLSHINDKWHVLTEEGCIPVHVTLQLMDHSSLGRGSEYQDFQRTSRHLQRALRSIVNEHHQGFNSSIGTFHKIQSSIQASQSRVRALKQSVHDAKSSLMEVRPELQGLGASSQKHRNMLHILAQIEKLQAISEQLDSRIADKQFLTAVDLLQSALRMIRRSEMESIGALSDLRLYFGSQETSLTDILVEELHDHLYLKSPACQDRWKSHLHNQQDSDGQVAAALRKLE
ncbi:MAG: hypothetical protein Q9174_000434 [Haloplaca sp. 1 TL-2023]